MDTLLLGRACSGCDLRLAAYTFWKGSHQATARELGARYCAVRDSVCPRFPCAPLAVQSYQGPCRTDAARPKPTGASATQAVCAASEAVLKNNRDYIACGAFFLAFPREWWCWVWCAGARLKPHRRRKGKGERLLSPPRVGEERRFD
jgi:hypothetical protein